jgi:hypothetical protein
VGHLSTLCRFCQSADAAVQGEQYQYLTENTSITGSHFVNLHAN